MFKLTDEQVTVYPHMVLMHPTDYANLDRTDFNPFSRIYTDKLTGDRIWPTNTFETCPNWSTPRKIGSCLTSSTMCQLREAGRLVHTWREYTRRLSEETLFKTLYSSPAGEISLASTVELPDIISPIIGNFYCNNQISTGSVYRTENDEQIFLFAYRPDTEEVGLGNEFAILPKDWYLSEATAVMLPGDYVFAPGSYVPCASEPITPIILTSRYRARTVIGEGGWLMGVMLTEDNTNEQ